MANINNGYDGIVQVNEISIARVTNWSISESVDVKSYAFLGSTAKEKVSGLTNGSGTINCVMDPLDTAGQDKLKNGEIVTLSVLPTGNFKSQKKLTFDAIISSVETAGDAETEVSVNFSFEITGAIIVAVIPTDPSSGGSPTGA